MIDQYEREWWTIRAMTQRGGSFVQILGEAAMRADRTNLAKLKSTWADTWKEYEKIGIELENKEIETTETPQPRHVDY